MDAADLIERARDAAGLSQRELGERAGTSGPTISFYETGRRVPRVDTLVRIVGAAGARLHVEVESVPIDLQENGRRLKDVLDLADALPQEHDEHLAYPVLRALTS